MADNSNARGRRSRLTILLRCMSLLLAHSDVGRSSAFGELRLWEDIRLGEGTQPC